jgi:hypothetical protein
LLGDAGLKLDLTLCDKIEEMGFSINLVDEFALGVASDLEGGRVMLVDVVQASEEREGLHEALSFISSHHAIAFHHHQLLLPVLHQQKQGILAH